MWLKKILIDRCNLEKITDNQGKIKISVSPIWEDNDLEPGVWLRMYINDSLFKILNSDERWRIEEEYVINHKKSGITIFITDMEWKLKSNIKYVLESENDKIKKKLKTEEGKRLKQVEINKQKQIKKAKETQKINKKKIEKEDKIDGRIKKKRLEIEAIAKKDKSIKEIKLDIFDVLSVTSKKDRVELQKISRKEYREEKKDDVRRRNLFFITQHLAVFWEVLEKKDIKKKTKKTQNIISKKKYILNENMSELEKMSIILEEFDMARFDKLDKLDNEYSRIKLEIDNANKNKVKKFFSQDIRLDILKNQSKLGKIDEQFTSLLKGSLFYKEFIVINNIYLHSWISCTDYVLWLWYYRYDKSILYELTQCRNVLMDEIKKINHNRYPKWLNPDR